MNSGSDQLLAAKQINRSVLVTLVSVILDYLETNGKSANRMRIQVPCKCAFGNVSCKLFQNLEGRF
jgi:hypothetical protein